MSEAIKVPRFRGKRLDNGEWVEGFYSVVKGNHYIMVPKDAPVVYTNYPIHPTSLGLSTGLKDKHGVEIFGSLPGTRGGDIVRYFLYSRDTVWPKENPEKDGWKMVDGHWQKELKKHIEYRTDKGGFFPFGYHAYDPKGYDVEILGPAIDLEGK